MVQVENEVGLLRDSRDRSPVAEAAWTVSGAGGAARPPRSARERAASRAVGALGPAGEPDVGHVGGGRSATTGRPTRCSWPGASRATAARSRPPARRSSRCRCTRTPGSARSPGSREAGDYPERRPGRPGDRRLEGRGAVPRPRRTRHLRRRREAGAARLRPAGQPAVRPRVAVRRRPDVLGARAPPGAGVLGLRRRPRPPRRPARPRLHAARRAGGRRHGRSGRGTDRRRPARRGRDRVRVPPRRLRRRRPQRARPARPDAARRRCRRTATPAAAARARPTAVRTARPRPTSGRSGS